MDWCEGLGFIIICTSLVAFGVKLHLINRYAIRDSLRQEFWRECDDFSKKYLSKTVVQLVLYFLVTAGILTFLIIDSLDDTQRLISITGLAFLIVFGVVFSKHPTKINWRQVTWGFALQFVFGLLVLRWSFGREVINCLGNKVEQFLAYTNDGSIFLYEYLVSRQPYLLGSLNDTTVAYEVAKEINESKATPGITAFVALTVIYFFNFVINILFYLGTVTWLTDTLGSAIEFTMGTTTCESVNAAANIFLGQTMSPLLIQPYIPKLTMSELHAIICSGFATIAGNVFAIYVSLGVDASHLVSASVMSAPAALAYAKLLYPETEESQTSASNKKKIPKDPNGPKGIMDAASRGAEEGATLVLNITSILISMVAFMAFLNGIVNYFAVQIGLDYINFEWILGKIFMPLAWMMGIPWDDCAIVGELIGTKLVLNEFLAYRRLGILAASGELGERTVAITTYALCGYANPASMGITLAVMSSLYPPRRPDYSKLIFRGFVAGANACFLTACFAGALISDESKEIDNLRPENDKMFRNMADVCYSEGSCQF